MQLLLSHNRAKFLSSGVKVGHNFVQIRQSRRSVNEHKLMVRLKRQFLLDKPKPNLPVIESPISLIDPNTGQYKTSITVDILGRETLPKLTEWRKSHLIAKTRRLLPLPISLTGLGDGQMPRFWTHVMKKASLKLSETHRMSELNLYERIPLSLRIFIENNGEKVRNEWPEVYQNYIQAKELHFKQIDEQIKSNETKVLQFPYEMVSYLKEQKNLREDSDPAQEMVKPRFQSGHIDTEYEDYLKHHHLMQYFAATLKGIKTDEYEGEIEGWRDQFWLRNYGTSDASVQPSHIGCSGCGARLHCTAPNIPGYMPSERFKALNERELRDEKCQRCEYLAHFNVALNVNVKSDQYPELIAQISNKKALVVIMVDLLDFPCSVWPGIINLIGSDHKVYIVGNKVDLLPKDNELYLERALFSLKKSLQSIGIDKTTKVMDVSLISAKTGWGIENLITKLMRDRRKGEDLYLIGCTNVGKSTLFNALMQSDLCKLRDVDLISRATTSLWPGTTLNLIKFPIREPTGWELQLRLNRLNIQHRNDINEWKLRRSIYRRTGDSRYATLSARIGMTYSSKVPFTVQSGHPFAKKPDSPEPFDPNSRFFKDSDFFCDTPGTIYKDQILTLLTTEELLRTIPREIITPRTFSLRPLQSLFIGGLARIDLSHARQQVWLTVFASHYLPIHVVYTEEAQRFYDTYLGTDLLGVPVGGTERTKHWPRLTPKEFEVQGINWTESCADIVLSSVGWVSVTSGPDTRTVLRAFTPEGRGIYLRQPPLLPFAFKLRGKRIVGTPCFENKLFTIDDLITTLGPKRVDSNNNSGINRQKQTN